MYKRILKLDNIDILIAGECPLCSYNSFTTLGKKDLTYYFQISTKTEIALENSSKMTMNFKSMKLLDMNLRLSNSL